MAMAATATMAQTYNPYQSIGREARVLTLSNGKYEEFFDTDTLEVIGSAILNTKTMKVIGFVVPDTLYSEANLEPELVSRWLSPDPLAAKYPELSPYHSFANNPILYVDEDGRENVIYIAIAKDKEGKPEVDVNDARAIARKTNELLKNTMGLNTRLVLIEDGTILEETDNVVTIGTNRKNIQTEMAKYSPGFANSESINDWTNSSDPSNPEKGNNRISPDKVGGVVDVDDISRGLLGAAILYNPESLAQAEKNIQQNDPQVIVGIMILHASGHAAQLNHSHNLMVEGSSMQQGIRNGTPATFYAEINGEAREAWNNRYSTKEASTLKGVGKRPVRTKVDQ